MQYIIMSEGKGTRWNNYLGISKQEAEINGERILDRTIRLLREMTNDPIYISSINPKHENKNALRIVPHYIDYFHRKYVYEFLNQSTIYLYGDTFYNQEAIDIIINIETNDVLFFGNETAIIAVKVQDYIFFKKVIDELSDDRESLYHAFDKFGNNLNRFVNVGNTFKNINTGLDYEELKKYVENSKKLELKREL